MVRSSLGNDGKIYCTPAGATDILIIDPSTGTATRSNMGANLSDGKWQGSSLGTDGKIYGVPYYATDILIIDPSTGTATEVLWGTDLSGDTKWYGSSLVMMGRSIVFLMMQLIS